MLDNILIPTDGSVPSERAAEFGVKLAKLSHGKVSALYVVDTGKTISLGDSIFPFENVSPTAIDEMFTGIQSSSQKEGEIATEFVERLAKSSGVPCKKMVVKGYPANEILKIAEENKIDLIVIGSIGRTGSTEFLLGGVAGRVVQNSIVPVLVVPGADYSHSRQPLNFALNSILTPTDGSEPSEQAAKFGVRLAKLSRGRVSALYVADTSKLMSLLGSAPDKTGSSAINDASARLRSFSLKEGETAVQLIEEFAKDLDVPFEKMIIEGYPASEILRVAEENRMDLIAMGSIGKTGLEDIYLGGVAGKVVRNASVPVLVVPKDKSR
ncbi:MAG: universal stress protein [Methanotrichaceae archaeon]